jgi:hypothetical protein
LPIVSGEALLLAVHRFQAMRQPGFSIEHLTFVKRMCRYAAYGARRKHSTANGANCARQARTAGACSREFHGYA